MTLMPYYIKFEPDKAEEGQLNSVPEGLLRQRGYRNVYFGQDDERNGWYRKIGAVSVPDEVYQAISKKDLVLTKMEAEQWLKQERKR